MTSLWPFFVWGTDIIRKNSPKGNNGHEYILVAIDYFTKWVEDRELNAKKVAKFIRRNIICRYGVPHEIIFDNGTHFEGEANKVMEEYGVQMHKSSPYWPQTNGAVEAANKNVKNIINKMVKNGKDCWISYPTHFGGIEQQSEHLQAPHHFLSSMEWK